MLGEKISAPPTQCQSRTISKPVDKHESIKLLPELEIELPAVTVEGVEITLDAMAADLETGLQTFCAFARNAGDAFGRLLVCRNAGDAIGRFARTRKTRESGWQRR